MRLRLLSFAVPMAILTTSCGGGSPTGPTPTPTPPTDVRPVSVVAFYDENLNGILQSSEHVRVPGVTVSIGGRMAQTDGSGRATVEGVPVGAQMVAIRSAPPFYALAAPLRITVPVTGELQVPLILAIGGNRPNHYLAFGDSITIGDGSRDGLGYRGMLETRLARYYGTAEITNGGEEATKSKDGAQRIRRTFGFYKPAFTLIQYGTNDWNQCASSIPCYTIDSLRQIIGTVKTNQGLPVLATIIPANPELNPAGRNEWVHEIDALIRTLAKEQGALLVDLEAAFLSAGHLSELFSDHVHPNDQGYRIMADEFFKALTQPVASSSFDDFEPFGFDASWATAETQGEEDGPATLGGPGTTRDRRSLTRER